MFKSILSKVGFGELPSSFGFAVGEKVDLPFQWHWDLHKGQKKSDGSVVSVFVCGKKDLDSQQVAAAKNAVQMAKTLRHTRIVRALDSIEVDSGFYLVTEPVMPLLSGQAADRDEREPAVWGLYEALEGLAFLHQSGLTHGLFGPSAILVTPRGDYRLGVFDLCRKDADAAALLMQRRRCSVGLIGWPDPPAYLQESGAPTVGVDLWGVALLAAYIFGAAKASRPGADFRPDMARAAQDLPPELRKRFPELVKLGPLKGRSPVAELLELPFFQQHSSVRIMSFLGSLHIKSIEEKDAFFEALPKLLESSPQTLQTRQVLPELLEAQKFPGQEAAQVLPAILKIGIRLKDDEFKDKVAPLVAQLFSSPDRAIRFRLLSSLGEMIDLLDDRLINDKIFPECVNGFTDSSGPIREATVKSLIFFVPRLQAKTVEGRVVKLLVKMMQDPEASIRTNAVICSGRISVHLPPAIANQTLAAVLAAGFKDPFAPCRSATLKTLLATCALFTTEELANRMMPGVCQRLVDPDPGVSQSAFEILASLRDHVKQQVDESRAAAGAEGDVAAAVAATAAAAGQSGGGWGSWAFSTVGSVVGSKIIGSMGPSRPSSEGITAPGPGAAPAAPGPSGGVANGAGGSAAGMGPSSSAGGMKLGGASGAVPAPPPAARSSGFGDDDDVGAPGDAWGGDGADFWGEFGDVPEAPPEEKPAASRPAAASAPTAARARPAPKATPAAPATGSAPKAQAKPAPKAQVLEEEDDFWKQFDM